MGSIKINKINEQQMNKEEQHKKNAEQAKQNKFKNFYDLKMRKKESTMLKHIIANRYAKTKEDRFTIKEEDMQRLIKAI